MKKKSLIFVFFLFFAASTFAQILVTQTESVEGTIFPAPGWKVSKGLNNPASNVSNFSRVAAASAANPSCGAAPGGGANVVMFNSWSSGTNDDYYMISKPFDFSNNSGNNPVFSFWMYRDAGSPGVNDKIEVYWNNTPTTTGMVAINHAGGVNFINRPIASFPTVAAAGWYQYTFSLPAATYNGKRNYFVIHGVSQFGQNMYLDNFVCNTYPTAMSPGDVTFDLVQQNQSTTSQGATNQWILGVRCVVGGTSGCGNLNGPLPVKLDSLLFNTNGTSNVADITNAKIYYTGGSPLFSTGYVTPFPTAGIPANTSYPKTQFGSTLSSIGTNIDFTNAAASCFFLEYDTTYFWITYDISATAAGNNYLDADFRGAAVGGTALTCPSPGGTSSALLPVTYTLTGAVQVDIPYCVPTYTTGTAWAGYTNNDYVQSVSLVGYGGTNINTTTNAVSLQLASLPCYPNCRFVQHPPDYEYRSPGVPNQAVTLQQGASYSITVQAGTWFSSNYIRAWIDYNHNGVFEATELLGTANLAANGFQTFPFTVPAAGFTGNTRIRVREVFATPAPDPCAQYTYGECEDFVCTIIPNCSGLYKLWLGNNNDWNNPANWCPSVPTINDDVVINKTLAAPSGTYYNPVIKSGILATCKNITIAVTDTLTIDAPNPSAASFKAKGTVTNNGQIRFTTSYTPTINVATGTLLNFTQTPLPGKTYKAGQTQIIYTAAELAGYGMLAGDQITAIKLNVKNNDVVTPTRTYNNFSISYLNSAAVFSAYASTTAIAGAFTTVYSNAAQPIVFGVNILTLGSPITWDGVNNICLQYCYTNLSNTGSTNNDYIDVTQTTGRNSVLILGRLVASAANNPAACSFVAPIAGDITANGGTTATSIINVLSQFRPNATFVLSRPYGKPKVVVQGSWINNNSFLAGTSSFVMDSYKSNRIGGTQPTTFYTFTMNKVTATTASVTSALGNGTSITYSAAGHTYSVGQQVEITGLTPAGYNASGTISAVVAGVSFTIAGTQTGASSGTGVASVETATASNARPIYLDQDVTIQDTFYLTAGQMIMNGKTLTMIDPRPSAFWRTQLTQASGTPAGVGTGFLISENAASVVNWNVGAYTAPTSARAIPFGNRLDTVSAAITYMPVTFLHKSGDLGTFKAATKYWAANVLPDPPTVTHINTYNSSSSNAAQTADRYWMIGKTGPQNPATNYPVVDLTFRFSNTAVPATERPTAMSALNQGRAQPWRAGSFQWMRITANATLNVYTIPAGGVSANGTTITYTTSVAHAIQVGQAVTMTGITPAAYNIVGGIVTAVTATTFTIANPTSVGPSTIAGTVTGSPAAGATNYNVQQTTLNYVQSYTQVASSLDSVRITSWDWPTAPSQGLPSNYPAAPVGNFTPWTITNNNTPLGAVLNSNPILLSVATSGNESCPNTNDGYISINVSGGTAPYTFLWNDGSISQNRTGLTAGNYTLTVTDASTLTSTISVSLTTNNLPPSQLSSIIGGSFICTSNNASFSVNAVANASLYQWNVPANSSIVSGQGTNNIVVNFNSSFVSGNVCVVASNTCGTTNQVCKTVNANTGLPASPDSVYGAITACPNDTLNYYVNSTANTSEYLWAVPIGCTIVNGQQTNSITVAYSSSFVSGTISCSSVNACGLGPITRNLNITRKSVPTTPSVIVGSNYGVCNSTKVFSVTNVSGVQYLWTVPSGAIVVSGQGTNSVSINFNGTFVSGPITVYAYTSCGNSPIRSKTIYGKPNKPTTVSGPTMFCVGDTATYTCTSVAGATSYDWTVPSNTTIISGQGTTILKIKRIAAVTNGSVCVKASNTCGSSANNCLTINVSAIPASINSIVGTANGICNALKTFSVTNQSGIVFTWSVPNGCTIQSGQGTYKITVQVGSSFTTGDITVTASSACGVPTTAYKTISGAPTSPSSITGLTQLCSNQTAVNYSCTTVSGATQYNWTTPSGSIINFGQSTNAINVDFNSLPGTFGSVKVQTGNSCGNSTYRTLAVSFVQCIARSQEMFENISLFPNPATNEVTIDLGESNEETISVKCVNAIGQIVYQSEMMSQNATLKINTSSFAEGLYIITLNNENIENKMLKVMIER